MLIERDGTNITALFVGPMDGKAEPEQSVALLLTANTVIAQHGHTLTIYAPPLKIVVKGEPAHLTQWRDDFLRQIQLDERPEGQ